jgi:hypothetical protein
MSQLTAAWRASRWYRRLAANQFPRLLIIGAQKGGTSALFAYLAQHPGFAPARYKEVSFFNSELRFAYGLQWYAAQWDGHPSPNIIRFEASPQYLYDRQAPGRIHASLPHVRLVAILRDPVGRAYSAWKMYRSLLAEDPEFYKKVIRTHHSPEEAAAIEPRTVAEQDDFWLAIEREVRALERGRSMEWGVVEPGLYGPQLQRYFELFPHQRLLVLDAYDLRTDRVRTLNRVLAFTGLPAWDWSRANLGDVFVGTKSAPMPERARDFLREYYGESNRLLRDVLDVPPLFARDELPRRASA